MLKFRRGPHFGSGPFRLPTPPAVGSGSNPYTERCAEPPQPAPSDPGPINMHKAMAGHTGAEASAMWPNNGDSSPPRPKVTGSTAVRHRVKPIGPNQLPKSK